MVDIRGSDEVVEQLRRGMARLLPLGSLHIGFREVWGSFFSGYGWTGFCCIFRAILRPDRQIDGKLARHTKHKG